VPLDQQAIQVEMPASAVERLKEMGGTGPRHLFTGDLSVNELMLVRAAGFEPLGLVVGSSVYHVGFQPMYRTTLGFAYADQELTVLTQAKYNARELAMARMEAEADALGADGIVGVRLDTAEYEWGRELVEFRAVGTAVRAADGGSYRTRFGKPFTSDLSGQDLRTLLRAGYRPQGLVMGTTVYVTFQNGAEFLRLAGWGWNVAAVSAEITQFTQAVYAARELAMTRMEREARELGAVGIVGMQLTIERDLDVSDSEFAQEVNDREHGPPSQRWRMFKVDILAIGTAVTAQPGAGVPPPPGLVVPLDRRPRAPRANVDVRNA
jgi:uncharacterized protein YbjQ (UPF0145 family)